MRRSRALKTACQGTESRDGPFVSVPLYTSRNLEQKLI